MPRVSIAPQPALRHESGAAQIVGPLDNDVHTEHDHRRKPDTKEVYMRQAKKVPEARGHAILMNGRPGPVHARRAFAAAEFASKP